MPSLGTAPHRISPGVWVTRGGRSLTPAGARYWEHHFRTGFTDGRGHLTTPSVLLTHPKPPKPPPTPTVKPGRAGIKEPSFFEKVQGSVGHNPRAVHREHLFRQTQHQPHYNPHTAQSTAADALLTAQNPHAALDAVITALSPYTALKETGHALQHHNIPMAGVAALGILPFGPGKARQAAKAAKAAMEVEKATKVVRAAPAGAEDVLKAAAVSKAMTPELKALQSAEKGTRVAKAQAAYESAGGGLAGQQAALHELKGPLPILKFDALAHVDATTMESLTKYIWDKPDLQFFEKLALTNALGEARVGKSLTPSKVKLVERVFGPLAGEEIKQAKMVTPPLMRAIEEVWNAPRAIIASMDVSAVFRQSLLATVSHPGMASKNIGPMFKMLFNQKYFDDVQRRIMEDPDFERALDHKVPFTDLKGLEGREEYFASNFAEKITGGKYSFVRASGRAYTGFLNLMRLGLYKHLVKIAEEQGINLDAPVGGGLRKLGIKSNMTEGEGIGELVGWATGRGKLPGKLEDPGVAVVLNTFLFSPRLFASRFNALNPLWYASLPKVARHEAIRQMATLVGAGTAVLSLAALAGAKIVSDPTNADFGKMRFGNKRVDLWGGHMPIARLYAQLYTGRITSSQTGRPIPLSGGFGGKTKLSVIGRFLRSKENPSTSIVHDFFAGTDFQNKPFSWKREALARSWPLLLQDTWDVYSQSDSPWQAGLMYGIGSLGIGVQSYGTPPPKQDSIDKMIDRHLKKSSGSSGADVDQMIEQYLNQ